jgi:hypothetical protein
MYYITTTTNIMILCIGCNKKFKYIGSFDTHLKKRKCSLKYICILPDIYIQNAEKINLLFKNKFDMLINNSIDINPKFGCEKCGELYKSKNYMYQHRKKICKENELTKYINNEVQEIDIQNIKHITELGHGMENSNNTNISNNNNNYHTNNSNHTNNGIGGDMNNTVINNNIIIKNYNDENDDEIINTMPVNMKKKLLKTPDTAIQDLYKFIHMDTPEYRNIYIGHPKNGYGMIMENGNWRPIKMKELMDDIIVKNSDRLYDIANDDDINIKTLYKTKIGALLDTISDNGIFNIGLRQDIKLVTYGYKKIIKETYKNSMNNSQKYVT